MPLILKEQKDKFSFMVWKIQEDLSFFLDKFDICDAEKAEIENYPEYRLVEWWSSRYLLFLLRGKKKRACVLKDEFGKPYLQNNSKNISISHSEKYIAAAISTCSIGIDIQKVSPKAELIKKKFLSQAELESGDDLQALNLMWTIKEAVYKAYGKRKLIFKDDIRIKNLEKNDNIVNSKVVVRKNNTDTEYSVVSNKIENAILSVALKN